jgi:lipoprotein-releasing system ATP-binding protein
LAYIPEAFLKYLKLPAQVLAPGSYQGARWPPGRIFISLPGIFIMLTAVNIHKSFGSLEVLKGIDIELRRKEIISVVGASGAGKSTLLHILGTLDRADKGRVMYEGLSVESFSDNDLSEFRNKNIGFVFQFHHLLPEFTALENICIPAFIAGLTRKEAEKKGLELMHYLRISERKHHKPSELSGGEQQRVAVARALINRPKVILADEPSGNLDSQSALELHKLFFDLRDAFGQSFIIVTHNMDLAGMADRMLTIKDGVIQGPS